MKISIMVILFDTAFIIGAYLLRNIHLELLIIASPAR